MIRQLLCLLGVTLGPLAGCIERTEPPINQGLDATVDARIDDAQISVDGFDPTSCAQHSQPRGCAAAGCIWIGYCTDEVAPQDAGPPDQGARDAGLRDLSVEDAARAEPDCVVLSDGQCVDRDAPDRCGAAADASDCARLACHWWRRRGADGLACHLEPAPTLADCSQPDAPSCDAAGCEWSGVGCAPPGVTACSALDMAACADRVECAFDGDCQVRVDVDCATLGEADCAARLDCARRGLLCEPLPDGACADLEAWACDARPDCAAIYPECNEQKRFRPFGGAGGEGGFGGGLIQCAFDDECGPNQWCSDEGDCRSCNERLGCGPL